MILDIVVQIHTHIVSKNNFFTCDLFNSNYFTASSYNQTTGSTFSRGPVPNPYQNNNTSYPPSDTSYQPYQMSAPAYEPTGSFPTPETDFQGSAPYSLSANNSFTGNDEYNPEEEPETWENEPTWDAPPGIDTPESPPMFEKESYNDPIEYHELSKTGRADIDHRVLPVLPNLKMNGNYCSIKTNYKI